MKRYILWQSVLLLTLGIGISPVFAQQGDAEAAKALFLKRCAVCHGANGEGKEAVAKSLKVQIRHLGSKEVLAKSDAQLKAHMLEGTGKMKPVKDLKDSEAAAIIAYLRTLEKK
jgi:mono/diheme cytochrome c family protein